MKNARSLKALLIISIGTTVIGIATFYSIALFFLIHAAENQLMGSAMKSTLEGIITYDLSQGRAPRLDQFSRLYIEKDPSSPIPSYLENQPLGYKEYTEEEPLHIYTGLYNGKKIILTRNQEVFEAWEIQIFKDSLVLWVVLIVFSIIFSSWLVNKLLTPLKWITNKALEANNSLENGQIYSVDLFRSKNFSNDEIGTLANALNNLTSKIRDLALKEKDFSREVSHEIRTPLTVIDTSMELLSEQCSHNQKQLTWINQALNASARIRGLTEVFLNLSRQERGQKNNLISIKELLIKQLPQWKHKAEPKNLYIRIDAEQYPTGEYNEVLLLSIFDNLISNSLRFTEKGGVTITVFPDRILIKDTGIGIKEEDREKIFASGYQAKEAENFGGFGLGLAIARRAADAFGWSISLRDDKQPGTCFEVRLRDSK